MLTEAAFERLLQHYAEHGGTYVEDANTIHITAGSTDPEFEQAISKILNDCEKLGIKADYNPSTITLSISKNTLSAEQISTLNSLLQEPVISAPIIQISTDISKNDLIEARIPHGRILFRGDARPPSEIFEKGFSLLKSSQELLVAPYASNAGATIALTPYLNTAAIFPIPRTEKSSTWIYIVKVEQGMPIAPVSYYSRVYAGYKQNSSASYPAEVITNEVKPENIMLGILVRREWNLENHAAVQQPKGIFKISEIIRNPYCTVDINTSSMSDFIDYLNECQAQETPLPFALSENSALDKSIPKPPGLDASLALLAKLYDGKQDAELKQKIALLFTRSHVEGGDIPGIVAKLAENHSHVPKGFYAVLLNTIREESPFIIDSVVSPAKANRLGLSKSVPPILSAIKADNPELVLFWIEQGANLKSELTPEAAALLAAKGDDPKWSDVQKTVESRMHHSKSNKGQKL